MGVIFLKRKIYASKKKPYSVLKLFSADRYALIVMLLVFAAGICVGACSFNAASEEGVASVKTSADTFFSVAELSMADKYGIFISTFKRNITSLIIIWLSGFFVFSVPLIFIQLFLKGVRIGFSSACFSVVYGLGGAIYSTAELLAVNFLILPLLVLYGAYTVSYARKRHRMKSNLLRYKAAADSLLTFSFVCVICVLASGINGYVMQPVFRLLCLLI